MRIVDNGWRMPFFGKLEKHVGFRIRSKGTLCGKSVYQAKKFGDVDPKIATSQKAQFTKIFTIFPFSCKLLIKVIIDKERSPMKKASVGNIIEFKNGLRGIVEKVNENSVIVDLTYMENYRELDLEERTVVNHKHYKIVEE